MLGEACDPVRHACLIYEASVAWVAAGIEDLDASPTVATSRDPSSGVVTDASAGSTVSYPGRDGMGWVPNAIFACCRCWRWRFPQV